MDPHTFSDQALAIMTDRLADFRGASSAEKKAIIKSVWRKVLDVERGSMAPLDVVESENRIRAWFTNANAAGATQPAKPKAQKKPEGSSRRRHWKEVLVRDMKDEVVAAAMVLSDGAAPGSQPFLGVWKAAVELVAERVSPEERDAFEAEAELWSTVKPPADVQAKVAVRKGRKLIHQFADKIYREAGMRIFVLAAYKDEHGKTVMEEFDTNDSLDDGFTFKDNYNWEEGNIMSEWAKFANEIFDGDDAPEDGPRHAAKSKRSKPTVELVSDENGYPLLPDDIPAVLQDMKDLVRAFITESYRIAADDSKVAVPWSAIARETLAYIDEEYLPPGFSAVQEPTKMNKSSLQTLLKFWAKRQSSSKTKVTFKFKKVHSNHDASNVKRPRGRGKSKAAEVATINEKAQAKGKTKASPPSNEEEEDEDVDEEASSPANRSKAIIRRPRLSTTPPEYSDDDDDSPRGPQFITPAGHKLPADSLPPTTNTSTTSADDQPSLILRAPASINKRGAERELFLNSLWDDETYSLAVGLTLRLPDVNPPKDNSPYPVWANWEYSGNHCPRTFHVNPTAVKKYKGLAKGGIMWSDDEHFLGKPFALAFLISAGMLARDLQLIANMAAGTTHSLNDLTTSSFTWEFMESHIVPLCARLSKHLRGKQGMGPKSHVGQQNAVAGNSTGRGTAEGTRKRNLSSLPETSKSRPKRPKK